MAQKHKKKCIRDMHIEDYKTVNVYKFFSQKLQFKFKKMKPLNTDLINCHQPNEWIKRKTTINI